jgi:CDGSH-type Zn-finger protein
MSLNKDHEKRSEIKLAAGERVALCRCWQSKKFPFCDGSHNQHNEAHNDQLGPIIITTPES